MGVGLPITKSWLELLISILAFAFGSVSKLLLTLSGATAVLDSFWFLMSDRCSESFSRPCEGAVVSLVCMLELGPWGSVFLAFPTSCRFCYICWSDVELRCDSGLAALSACLFVGDDALMALRSAVLNQVHNSSVLAVAFTCTTSLPYLFTAFIRRLVQRNWWLHLFCSSV